MLAQPWEGLRSSVDSWCSQLGVVMMISSKCGVQPWAVGSIGLLWIASFVLWGFTGELISTAVGVSYPIFASFRALEDDQHAEMMQWLTYWVTYAAITLAESFLHKLLVWVPFYHILRLIFTAWLFLPMTRGAHKIYAWLLGPVLRRYRSHVDAALASSTHELHAKLWSQEVRSRLQKAMEGMSGGDLGIDDLVARELAKAANAEADKFVGATVSKTGSTGGKLHLEPHLAVRRRTASPKPSRHTEVVA